MGIKIDTLKCTGCRICEYACSYHHDGDYSAIGSSLMLHRAEKKDYFGMMWKRPKDLYLARPEGEEIVPPGEQAEGAGASSKPILMRGSCDECEDEDVAFCHAVCPTGCIQVI